MNTNTELHVIFGAGPIGLAVVNELVKRGKQVRVITRSGRANVPAGVEVCAGDASDPDSARRLSQGAAVIYNCVNAPDYHKWPEQFPPLQAGIIAGAAANGAKLVVMDNLYMYGPHDGKPMTEDMPMRGRGSRGGTRVQMTRDLMAAHASGKVRVAVGRAADYFGPGGLTSQAGERMFYPAIAGSKVQVLGDPDLPHTLTYIPDIGKALVILGERDEALGEIWHIPSAARMTLREFVTLIGQEAGTQPKIAALKKSAFRAVVLAALGIVNPQLRGLGAEMYQFDEPFILDTSKFEKAFGSIATPLSQAIRETVAWYQANPLKA